MCLGGRVCVGRQCEFFGEMHEWGEGGGIECPVYVCVAGGGGAVLVPCHGSSLCLVAGDVRISRGLAALRWWLRGHGLLPKGGGLTGHSLLHRRCLRAQQRGPRCEPYRSPGCIVWGKKWMETARGVPPSRQKSHLVCTTGQ